MAPEEIEKKQQFNVYLPSELIRAVKHAAVDNSVSLSVFVERALQAYLQQIQSSRASEAPSSGTEGGEFTC